MKKSILDKSSGWQKANHILIRPMRQLTDWPVRVQGEFRFRRLTDLKKQGKFGPDVPTPRETQYLCMRERGNGTDGLKSPKSFSNEIRTAIYHAFKHDEQR